ncbi:MAG TPA: mannose-6-phosphate isomerase [Deltaproteobacteria bacterium]|nr:MAG: mannose-6-phosphate isomerase [Deltaproteobacteria bacterium GWC2_65_14]HBO69806.1 mannose-6-phosphate isomerase [Deltaproteobacteria bacterium]
MTLDELAQSWAGEKGERPWGYYLVLLEAEGFKVKQFAVRPGKRLSLQRHRHRAEHWVLVRGEALVTLDGRKVRMAAGGSIDIPLGAVHRIENTGEETVVVTEVQQGEYLGEDDIERLEDDFGRA